MASKSVLSGILTTVLLTMAAVLVPGASAAPPRPPARNSGTLVIVFRDGHRQTFNLSEIERVEFPAAEASSAGANVNPSEVPPRGHFVGKWAVGDGNGGTFFITLKDNGDAERTLHAARGRWAYVNGEAQVTWDDGAMDLIRKVGPRYEKLAFQHGKKFTDAPDNTGVAKLVTEKPV